MTLEDPFFVVKEEVCRALTNIRTLHARHTDLKSALREAFGGDDSGTGSIAQTPTLGGKLAILNLREELEWTANELTNALRSIEWDLEDLDDTICIIQRNPSKFKIDNKELTLRRNFIEHTREEVQLMKEKRELDKTKENERTARQENSPEKTLPTSHGTAKYSKLENQIDSPNRGFYKAPICNQNALRRHQDDGLEFGYDNTGTLRTVSRQINSEYDERQVMLDELGNEMEIIMEPDSPLDSTMKKVAKVLHISNGNYNNYTPAPTASTSNTNSDYIPKSSSLCSLSDTITKCFYLCSKN